MPSLVSSRSWWWRVWLITILGPSIRISTVGISTIRRSVVIERTSDISVVRAVAVRMIPRHLWFRVRIGVVRASSLMRATLSSRQAAAITLIHLPSLRSSTSKALTASALLQPRARLLIISLHLHPRAVILGALARHRASAMRRNQVDEEGEDVESEDEADEPFEDGSSVVLVFLARDAKGDSERDLNNNKEEFGPEGGAEDAVLTEVCGLLISRRRCKIEGKVDLRIPRR